MMKSLVFSAILLVQAVSLVVAENKTDNFSVLTINFNTTCSIEKPQGTSHVPANIEIKNDTATLTIPLSNEKVDLTNTVVSVKANSGSFQVVVNTTAIQDAESASFTIKDNMVQSWQSHSISKKGVKNVYAEANNFSKNKSNMTACIGIGIAYGNESMTNITSVDLGCWTWINSTTLLGYTVPTTTPPQLDIWSKSFKKQFCNGCLSSVTIMPLFALILATLVTLFNQK